METPAFRPGRKRRFTSPEMSVVIATVFVCPGIACSPRPPRKRCCGSTARHARYVWNLAVEQHAHWHPGRKSAPGYLEQCRQLTQARAEHPWLAAGLPDGAAAGAAGLRPGDDGVLRPGESGPAAVVAQGRAGRGVPDRAPSTAMSRCGALSRHTGQVRIPKAGWVRFRWSRAVPPGVKSYRVTLDRAGRWHVAFAAIPAPVPAPGNGAGRRDRPWRGCLRGPVHRGDAARPRPDRAGTEAGCAAWSASWPGRSGGRTAASGYGWAIARLRARETDRRKDWAEKTSTDIARRFDVIRVEDLQISNMTRSAKGTRENPGRNVRQKAGLNRGILRSGWGLLVRRLQDKAPGRVEKIKPHSRASGARRAGRWTRSRARVKRVFPCTACGYACHADVNAARNIAAGHAVTARGGDGVARPVNREPHLLPPIGVVAGIPRLQPRGGCQAVSVSAERLPSGRR